MAYRCRFVDSISASPTVRLDLNDGTTFKWLADGSDFSPPEIRRAKAGTLLTEGNTISGLMPENRVVRLQLLVSAASRDALTAALSTLHVELLRVRNLLEVRTGTVSRFLRTFASPDLDVADEGALNRARVTLLLEADPYAYGLLVTQAGLSVANDPAAATRPCFLDVTGVLGDAPTPAIVTLASATAVSFAMGVRRHGTPSNALPWFVQAETFTLVTLSALGGPDAAMSGTGSDYVRTTMTTTVLTPTIVIDKTLTGLTVDHRGTYRAFARVRRTTNNSDPIEVQLHYGGGTLDYVYTNAATTTAVDVDPQLVDLGLIHFPISNDPELDASGAALGVGDTYVALAVTRLTGTGNFLLDFDYLMFVPADEEMTLIEAPSGMAAADLVLDGAQRTYYYLTSGKVLSRKPPTVIGSIAPMLSPGQTNRIVLLRDSNAAAGRANDITESTTVTVSHLPRYLYLS